MPSILSSHLANGRRHENIEIAFSSWDKSIYDTDLVQKICSDWAKPNKENKNGE